MKKKYRKPVVLQKEKNRVHAGSCGYCHSSGCGKLVVGSKF